ncbi:hypothetical protein [Paraburkholderia sp. D1E]|uniref:hypothetical protein n=1 Tax=Paraburkholderia sp. D1E TaxID=3461398 RepID=UPI0040467D65
MVISYFETLRPFVALTLVIDDFGNEIALKDLPEFWEPMYGAMIFAPFEHADLLCGEH